MRGDLIRGGDALLKIATVVISVGSKNIVCWYRKMFVNDIPNPV